MIPGLADAEFVRYGVMHRNTYIHSPDLLEATMETQQRKGLFFAGQMTGVEGYVESAASGIVAACSAAARAAEKNRGHLERDGNWRALPLYFSFYRKEFPADECEFRIAASFA